MESQYIPEHIARKGVDLNPMKIARDPKLSINDVHNRVQDNLGVARKVYAMLSQVRDGFYGAVPRPAEGQNAKNTRSGALPQIHDSLNETAEILQQMADEINILHRDLFGEEPELVSRA